MKIYKPKKWLVAIRILVVFCLVLLVQTISLNFSTIASVSDANSKKSLEVAIMDKNKEELFIKQNSVLTKYIVNAEKGFVPTIENKTYELSEEDFKLLVAVVSAESNKYADDILAVTSVILNRSDAGSDPISVITKRNQFSTYGGGAYLRYYNEDGTLTDNTIKIQEVVMDALNGVRNNNYYSFRSWNSVGYSDKYVVEGGNRFN